MTIKPSQIEFEYADTTYIGTILGTLSSSIGGQKTEILLHTPKPHYITLYGDLNNHQIPGLNIKHLK